MGSVDSIFRPTNNMQVIVLSAILACAAAAPAAQYHLGPVVAPYHAPVVAPYHAPVVVAHHAPVVVAHHAPAEIYADEVSPYTYTYAVADDYSKANFQAAETSDGAGTAQGSYSVALPDGRTQNVAYTANGYDGYVAEVTYTGAAVYPDAPAPYAAPAPAPYAG